MNSLKATLAALLLALFALLLSGCISGSGANNTIPWSSPASWENQVPGMGNNP